MFDIFTNHWDKICITIGNIQDQIDTGHLICPTHDMCELLIVGEDHRFYNHFGVDLFAVCRAIWKSFIFNERQGASTIAMQLVRTVTGCYEKTLRRKFVEMILAIRLTYSIDRERLPILYLCIAYYGWRMNDLQEACSRLKLNIDTINEIEAAKLVARLKYPEPSVFNLKRSQQIERRAKHLVKLRRQEKLHLKFYHGSIQSSKSIINSY